MQKKSMLKRTYSWCINNANTPKARNILYVMAFAESSFFPIPPDILYIPMVLANPKLAFRLAFWLTVSSVIGGILGYAIGYFLYQSLGCWIIDTYQLHAAFTKFQHDFHQYGFWIISLKGLTPIPYKLVTIASGAVHLNIGLFMMASVIARGFRFYLLAVLLYYFGEKARVYIEKYLSLALLIALGIILIGFILVKWLG